jgi:L-asparaginase
MKKKILLITTGGTIASELSAEGLKPGLTSGDLMTNVNSIAERYDVTTLDLFQLDSSNIQPEEWQLIARTVAESWQGYDGIVITHGTDTMAYTSSVLSFMLRSIPIPVVLTGSQLPVSHPLTDAKDNLFCAFAMAASGTPGVFLAFNRKVLRGCRAVKVRTMSFDAFESINCPPVAKVDVGGLIINNDLVVPPSGDFELRSELSSDVFLIKVIPGLNPRLFDMLQKTDCKGIVIEAFGAGGMHFMRRDLISALQSLADRGIIIVVCSQCLYESCDFSIYQTGMRLVQHKAIIQARDMTTESAVTKLMWCLGQTGSTDRLRSLFAQDLAGEISRS